MAQNADLNKYNDRLNQIINYLKNVLNDAGIDFKIDENNPLSPELIFSDERKIVLGEQEVLFVHGFNTFLNDYKYDVFCLGAVLDFDGLSQWIAERL